MRTLILALVSLLTMAPLAAAEYYEGKPDCPPDRFCTTSAGSEEPQPYGDEECIECSKPVDDSSSGDNLTRGEGSCMDGSAEYACRGDVQYLDGSGPKNDQEVDTTSAKKDVRSQDLAVPGVALAAVAAAIGLVAILVSRRP
ncbi:MAG TPA: hypothetical protein VM889_10090 [Candidatus Thermoplasmatota archaeon]|nr:hypothetical protein [Candidatus Thermoplasmatota archaeon]